MREAPCMPCQDCFHWQTRDSSLVIIFSSLPMESQALVFLQGPLWLQHSMLYFGDLKSKLFSKTLHAETQKAIWGIHYSPSIASIVFYGR